jgi:hypothetical protein
MLETLKSLLVTKIVFASVFSLTNEDNGAEAFFGS